MTDFFLPAIGIIFDIEKIYADHPSDPGGETKWGVARNEHPEISNSAWLAFTAADAVKIYRAQYWDRFQCGNLTWPWALGLFDGVVNEGGVAVSLMQAALGVVTDGRMGPGTVTAARTAAPELFHAYLALRIKSYSLQANWGTDGKGWSKRVVRIAWEGAVAPPNSGVL